MMKPEDVPTDVYQLLRTKNVPKGVDVDAVVAQFGEECMELMRGALAPDQVRSGRLRLSGVGKEDRKIFHDYHAKAPEDPDGATRIKFLYGHLVETMVLTLVKLSGHKVEDQQKQCMVEGVRGSMDGRIDGVVMDVKSCSSYGFKKFKEGTLPFDDPFGYVGQLKAYAHSEGETELGWLAMDKQNGTLCWLGYDTGNLATPELEKALGYDISERVRFLKEAVEGALPPLCYEPVADGKSGNMKLATGCSYCPHKAQCFPELRTFLYGSGPRYLTEVEREPNVPELVRGF